MILTIELDLKNIKTRSELFDSFNVKFWFPSYFWNNWNAFYDVMRSLDTDSKYISNITPFPEGIHLILLNYNIFNKQFNKQDLLVFKCTLFDLCQNHKFRYDNMWFTFELHNSNT